MAAEIKKDEIEEKKETIEIIKPDPGTAEGLLKMVAELRKANELQNETMLKMDQRMNDILESQKKVKQNNKTLWSTADAGYDAKFLTSKDFDGSFKSLLDMETKDPIVTNIQEMSDRLLIMKTVMIRTNPGFDIRQSKYYGSFKKEIEPYMKALAGTSGFEGADWVPTGFSSSLIEKVRLELKVAAVHQRINMPTNPFTLPIETGQAFASLVGESTSDSSTAIPATTPTTGATTFTAKKLATRILASAEITEDSIISILPWMEKQIVKALASAQEFAIINGDTSGTRDTTDQAGVAISPTSNIKAWDGYREIAGDIGQGVSIDAGGTFLTSGDMIRRARASMGIYGVNPSELVLITGSRGYLKHVLGIKQVQTVDKIGLDRATVRNGVLGIFEGIEIIVSEWMREDLNGDGVSGGTSSNTDTMLILANKDGFAIGDRRNITVKSEEMIDTDQIKIVATQRLDFQRLFLTSERVTANIHDLE